MSPQEKRLRIVRQVVIFGAVMVAFLIYVTYRLKTGDFG
ncbi:hypothetical protein SAMCFNEI73_Ch0306 [Sinorhizobium americanum]|uniref:Uncharacterized protein n=1 Tax=Sinorhizobium americanum TaxID=194963 RepID=A0A1L3LHU9_9HYPH|nr:hypothetical protein SAMCCGM7_Ch0308 [Sinorhizobium americanum CCGM7]APG89638.1 hypothetical protein SAMCFNEI73_Ch0306 [Sinorhizobium americanum]TCN36114.1 hypothetical protein EV184_101100 [Sinorhizobium americanum]